MTQKIRGMMQELRGNSAFLAENIPYEWRPRKGKKGENKREIEIMIGVAGAGEEVLLTGNIFVYFSDEEVSPTFFEAVYLPNGDTSLSRVLLLENKDFNSMTPPHHLKERGIARRQEKTAKRVKIHPHFGRR